MRINETSEGDLRRSTYAEVLLHDLLSYLYKQPEGEMMPMGELHFPSGTREFAYVAAREIISRGMMFHNVLIAFAPYSERGEKGSVRIISGDNKYLLTIYTELSLEEMTYRKVYYLMCDTARRSTFMHEVQHIIDLNRHNDKDNIAPTSANGPSSYYNDPLELNAYFHNFVEPVLERLRFLHKHSFETMGLFNPLPGDDFRSWFTHRQAHLYSSLRPFWYNLTDANKRKVISRASKLFDLYLTTYRALEEQHLLTQQQAQAVEAALGDTDINTRNA